MADQSPVKAQKQRADRAWKENSRWDRFYRDAYDYVIPQRRPGNSARSGKREDLADKIFDMTGPTSAMQLAGTLQRLLFSEPPSLETGALVHQAIGDRGKAVLDRELEKVGKFIKPFMDAGELDTATHETCIDLGVGTGALIPLRGTPDQPIVFYAPPADEIAIGGDAFGRQSFFSWKRLVCREPLLEAFPRGNFSDEIRQKAKDKPYDEVTLYQDFRRLPDGRWHFCAYPESGQDFFIAEEVTFAQPIAVAPYHRVPGEMRGRGPIMLALPSIKTLNKAQELALRSAAIQMLGIWGYRAGGTFNPDTVRVGPAQFWAMQSTGGMLGPDVQRLDPASANFSIANVVIEGLQQQIRDALMDTRLQPSSGTPKSASEVAALLRQRAQVHLGAFQRLWRSIMPVIVPRCCEILNSFGYLRGMMNFNQLMISVAVRSPMASALQAEKLSNLANYIELLPAFVPPDEIRAYIDQGAAADMAADTLMIDKSIIPFGQRREIILDEIAKQREAAQIAAMAERAAPQLAAGGLQLLQGGKEAA